MFERDCWLIPPGPLCFSKPTELKYKRGISHRMETVPLPPASMKGCLSDGVIYFCLSDRSWIIVGNRVEIMIDCWVNGTSTTFITITFFSSNI